MITGEDQNGETKEYPTVRDWLEDARVVNFKEKPDGTIRVREGCDNYFSCRLTREQLLMLADELRAMAGLSPATTAYLEWLKAGAQVTLPDGTKGRMTRDEMLSMAYRLWAHAGAAE